MDDFFFIVNEKFGNTDLAIKFELVYKQLDINESDFKKVFINKFSENIDYMVEKIKEIRFKN